MWARAIDGIILVSEDLAEQIKSLCIPNANITTNGETWSLGKNMDLERTGDDDRFWFYSEDETRALQINLIRSEDTYEICFVERKMYWFGALREKTIDLISLTFPDANLNILEK